MRRKLSPRSSFSLFSCSLQCCAALALSAVLLPASLTAAVQPGDVVVIRVASGGTHTGFSWLALRDIDSSSLRWTDSSWGRNEVDGVRQDWYPEGDSGMPNVIRAGTIGEVDAGTSLSYYGLGDQVFFYTGDPVTAASTTNEQAGFVWGITWGSDQGWLEPGSGVSVNKELSYQPETLGNLGMSTALGSGSKWFYNGPTSGTPESLQRAIADASNWAQTDSSGSWQQITQATITVVPEPASYAAMLGACCIGVAFWRRRRK